jgi:hypothetical protein
VLLRVCQRTTFVETVLLPASYRWHLWERAAKLAGAKTSHPHLRCFNWLSVPAQWQRRKMLGGIDLIVTFFGVC